MIPDEKMTSKNHNQISGFISQETLITNFEVSKKKFNI
jgi:hypothetical protein